MIFKARTSQKVVVLVVQVVFEICSRLWTKQSISAVPKHDFGLFTCGTQPILASSWCLFFLWWVACTSIETSRMTRRSLIFGLTYCRTSDLQSAKILGREVTIVLEKGLNLQAWCSWICGRISLMSKHQTFDLGGFTIHFAGRMMPRDDGSLVSFQVGRMDFKIHDLGCRTCCLNLGSAGLKLGLASWLKLHASWISCSRISCLVQTTDAWASPTPIPPMMILILLCLEMFIALPGLWIVSTSNLLPCSCFTCLSMHSSFDIVHASRFSLFVSACWMGKVNASVCAAPTSSLIGLLVHVLAFSSTLPVLHSACLEPIDSTIEAAIPGCWYLQAPGLASILDHVSSCSKSLVLHHFVAEHIAYFSIIIAGEYDCIPEGNFYLSGWRIAGDFAWKPLILAPLSAPNPGLAFIVLALIEFLEGLKHLFQAGSTFGLASFWAGTKLMPDKWIEQCLSLP